MQLEDDFDFEVLSLVEQRRIANALEAIHGWVRLFAALWIIGAIIIALGLVF